MNMDGALSEVSRGASNVRGTSTRPTEPHRTSIKKERVECPCGARSEAGAPSTLWILCEACNAWMHGQCVGYPRHPPKGGWVGGLCGLWLRRRMVERKFHAAGALQCTVCSVRWTGRGEEKLSVALTLACLLPFEPDN